MKIKMNSENLSRYKHLIAQADEGKTIQIQTNIGWLDINPNEFVLTDEISPSYFRIKQKSEYRAWKVNEVPIHALFRLPYNNVISTIIGTKENYMGIGDVILLSKVPHTYYPGEHFFTNDLITSKSNPEHSIDGGKTWHKCGIFE